MTGLYNAYTHEWDKDLLSAFGSVIVPSSPGLEAMLGKPRSDDGPIGRVSSWLVERHHFSPDTTVTMTLPATIASYLSFSPGYNDVGLQMGIDDYIIIPTAGFVPDGNAISIPSPVAFCTSEATKSDLPAQQYLTISKVEGAGTARKMVRDFYTNGKWQSFDRLTGAVCIGGTVGMDNKVNSIQPALLSSAASD
jgi:hypothetical protein